MKTCIMYPNNGTSLLLGRRLLTEDHHVSLYCPGDVHRRMAHTIPSDLRIANLSLTNRMNVKEIDSLENIKEFNNIIFPTTDVLQGKKRSDFGKLMGQLFRYVMSYIYVKVRIDLLDGTIKFIFLS